MFSFLSHRRRKGIRNVVCPVCGGHIAPDYRFCLHRGPFVAFSTMKLADTYTDPKASSTRCRCCGKTQPTYARFCVRCGRPMREEDPASSSYVPPMPNPADSSPGFGRLDGDEDQMPCDNAVTRSRKAVRNVVCPGCGAGIAPDSQYCLFCGRYVADSDMESADTYSDPEATITWCESCGTTQPMYARFCVKCGMPMRHSVPMDTEYLFGELESNESVMMQQVILETAYITAHGLEPGDDAAERLFPSGWHSGCSETHIKALAEALQDDILLIKTSTWQNELIEGVRFDLDLPNPVRRPYDRWES